MNNPILSLIGSFEQNILICYNLSNKIIFKNIFENKATICKTNQLKNFKNREFENLKLFDYVDQYFVFINSENTIYFYDLIQNKNQTIYYQKNSKISQIKLLNKDGIVFIFFCSNQKPENKGISANFKNLILNLILVRSKCK